MAIDPIKQGEDFLELFKIEKNKYIIGVFQSGITFYKQQIRALNIFHALMKTGILNKNSSQKMHIAVIGGGIGGLTFSAAALKSGFEVTVLEKESMLMPMQHACETRKIHPNIYDWPDSYDQSLSRYANIPVLSWQYDTASRVADQIRNGFQQICEENIGGIAHVDCDKYRMDTFNGENQITIDFKSKGSPGVVKADILIYAPGYGVETGGNSKERTPSYWKNDDLGQPLISRAEKEEKSYCISGVGDGGLIDLFRIKIEDFDLDTLFKIIKSDITQYNVLKNHLLLIKEKWRNEPNKDDKKWFNQNFKSVVPQTSYQYIINQYIIPKLVRNKHVTIIGNEEYFEDNLSLKRISLLNNFLAYILFNILQEFKYEWKDHPKIPEKEFDQKIIRHGTGVNRKLALTHLKIPKDAIDRLEKVQVERALYENSVQLWKYSDLVTHFTSLSQKKKIEYFRPETVSMCSSFVSVLSGLLNGVSLQGGQNLDFRMALHRVVEVDEQLHYQQITSFFRSNKNGKQGSIGRVYRIDEGSIGHSILTGKSLLIKKRKSKELPGLKAALKHEPDFDIKNRNSFLTIPVLGLYNGQRATNLVLYIDSNIASIFDNRIVIEIIYNALSGFTNSLNNLLRFKQIYMSDLNFAPPVINLQDAGEINNGLCIDLSKKYPFLKPNESDLVFDEYHSFDIMHNHPSLFKQSK